MNTLTKTKVEKLINADLDASIAKFSEARNEAHETLTAKIEKNPPKAIRAAVRAINDLRADATEREVSLSKLGWKISYHGNPEVIESGKFNGSEYVSEPQARECQEHKAETQKAIASARAVARRLLLKLYADSEQESSSVDELLAKFQKELTAALAK